SIAGSRQVDGRVDALHGRAARHLLELVLAELAVLTASRLLPCRRFLFVQGAPSSRSVAALRSSIALPMVHANAPRRPRAVRGGQLPTEHRHPFGRARAHTRTVICENERTGSQSGPLGRGSEIRWISHTHPDIFVGITVPLRASA